MKEIRVMILRTAGTNCNGETQHAFEKAGKKIDHPVQVDQVHINRLRKDVKLEDYHILALPGGFSYGDDIRAGAVLAVELNAYHGQALKQFVKDRKPVIGICNGFQVLLETGLLPNTNGKNEKEVTLTDNDSNKFEDRWGKLYVSDTNCIFTPGLEGQVIELPIAHKEGKFFTTNTEALRHILKNQQVVLRYTDKDGNPTHQYPANPNGSLESIAGITDPTGIVLGLMPHPERFIHRYHHPRWTRENVKEEGDGLVIFTNALNYTKENILR